MSWCLIMGLMKSQEFVKWITVQYPPKLLGQCFTWVSLKLFMWLSDQVYLDDETVDDSGVFILDFLKITFSSVQFSSVTQSYPTLCDPMKCSVPGIPVHHQLSESTQTHVHWVGDAIQPSHPLLSPSPPAPNPSQHRGLFQWVSSSHQVAKVLEFQFQHQSFQWIFRTDFL